MTKRQIIDAIMRINTSARIEFLTGFSEQELQEYLRHLEGIQDRRPVWRVYTQTYALAG